jgi:hypothetical protein
VATTANQSQAEWLSDILAALGFSGGGVSPVGGQKVQGMAADGGLASGVNPVVIGVRDSSGNIVVPWSGSSNTDAVASQVTNLRVLSSMLAYNGTTWDRQRSANAAANTTGTGLLGAGLLAFDGTNYQLLKAETAANPNLRVGIWNGAVQAQIRTLADDLSNSAALSCYSFQSGYNGINWDRVRVANVFKPVSLGAGTAETTIWTPAAGKKFRLMGFVLTTDVASTLTFKDNTGGTTIFTSRGGVNTPVVLTPANSNGILSAAANNVLTVTRGTSAALDGTLYGCEET